MRVMKVASSTTRMEKLPSATDSNKRSTQPFCETMVKFLRILTLMTQRKYRRRISRAIWSWRTLPPTTRTKTKTISKRRQAVTSRRAHRSRTESPSRRTKMEPVRRVQQRSDHVLIISSHFLFELYLLNTLLCSFHIMDDVNL